MNLKDWFLSKPYWVKGAVIGFIILLFYGLIFLSCVFSYTGWDKLRCIKPPLGYIAYSEDIAEKLLVSLGLNAPQGSTLLNSVTMPIGFVLLFSRVIIGALIGWIIGKIRNRKK